MKLSFESNAKLGYAILALLLAGGLALSIRRLTALAEAQIEHLRAEENDTTLVERLRWNAELIVSHGRGYLISAEPSLLDRVRDAEVRFDDNMAAVLRAEAHDAEWRLLVRKVAQAAERFRGAQRDLFNARTAPRDPQTVAELFETQLRPLRLDLERAVYRLVAHKEATLSETYKDAKRDRRRVERQLYVLLTGLLLTSIGVAWYFGTLLGRSYGHERAALEAARKAVAARDELMGLVAHDLRNPLGAITMKAALITKTATSDAARRNAESIENVARRMESLIKSLLDVATLEAGRFSLTRGACDVDGLLHEILDLFSNLAGSKRVRLHAEVTEHGLVIDADRDRVLQVLSNLVGNALKFVPQGGEVKLSIQRQHQAARFAISDTGPGIAASDVPRLFDRFWKRQASGTGLGLFIAKGIVDAHGGRIWAESQPGHGATFSFELPLVGADRGPV